MEGQPEKPGRSPLRQSIDRFMKIGIVIGLFVGLVVIDALAQEGQDPARLQGRAAFAVLLGGSIGALVGYLRFKIGGDSDREKKVPRDWKKES